jgi:hypothetical protein
LPPALKKKTENQAETRENHVNLVATAANLEKHVTVQLEKVANLEKIETIENHVARPEKVVPNAKVVLNVKVVETAKAESVAMATSAQLLQLRFHHTP